ncbi:ABC transporter permease [Roseomonas sp. CCTCC AB2023176]|uniref:ABC transporter permease n=1 Tax=Roseomonas sp. CCTCC AB2023176 TaxID=3342640 RepID=UPI0035DB46D7
MAGYVLRRVLVALPTLFLVAAAVFFLIRMIPGDPAQLLLGDAGTPEAVADLRASLGLDRPLPVQFLIWLERVASGDLGRSIGNGEEVGPLILDRFGVTAAIVIVAVTLAALIAVPLGMFAAWRQNSAGDVAAVAFATFMLSIPSFWLGLILLLVFGLRLGWVPVVGYVPFSEDFGAALRYVILPIATLALIETGVLIRMARASAVEVLRLDYVAHARAKGVPEGSVLARHVFPNAFAPTLTLIGLVLGNLLGGIAVIETVFTLPGLGRLLVDAIFARDYPVVQGVMLFVAVLYVLVNLAVDLLYPVFDPRVTAG